MLFLAIALLFRRRRLDLLRQLRQRAGLTELVARRS